MDGYYNIRDYLLLLSNIDKNKYWEKKNISIYFVYIYTHSITDRIPADMGKRSEDW